MVTGRVNASFEPIVDIEVVAADGTTRPMSVLVDTGFSGYTVQGHGRQRPVVVHEADGQPFIGMKLIAGSRMEVFAKHDGAVVIDELP